MNLSRNVSDNKEPAMRRSEESVSDRGKSRCKGARVERLSRLEQGVHKVFCKEPGSILGFVGLFSLLTTIQLCCHMLKQPQTLCKQMSMGVL